MKNKPWFWPKSRHFVDSAIMKPKIAVVRHLDVPHNIVIMAVCISKDAAIKIARALNNYEENRRQLRAIAAVVGQLEEIDLVCDTERSRKLDSLLKSAPPTRNCDLGRIEAEDKFARERGRPWNTEEDELAAWLYKPSAEGKEASNG